MSESFASPEGFEPLRPREEVAAARVDRPAYPPPADYGAVFDEGLELLRDKLLLLGGMAGVLLMLAGVVFDALNRASSPGSLLALVTFLVACVLVSACTAIVSGWAARSWFERGGPATFDLRRFTNTCVAGLLVGILGTLAGTPIIPIGLRVLYRLGYATTATAEEGLGPFEALRRSWNLTKKSERFGVWIGLILAGSLLSLLPVSFSMGLAQEAFGQGLRDLVGVNLGAVMMVLKPMGAFLLGLALAVPAVALGRFQLDLLARRDGTDLRERLATSFPPAD